MKSILRNLVYLTGIFIIQAGCKPHGTIEKMVNLAARSDQGTLIVTLGNDTTLLQHFRINGDSIWSDILSLPGGVRVTHGKGTLSPEGKLLTMDSRVYALSPDGELQLNRTNMLVSNLDSTIITTRQNGDTKRRTYPGNCYVSNASDNAGFYIFPFWGFFGPKNINDSITGNQLAFGDARIFTVKKIAGNAIRFGSDLEGYLTVYTDNIGRMISLDGIGSSLNITGKVIRDLDFDSLVSAKVRYQVKNGTMQYTTTRDSVIFNKGKLNIRIKYWRPSARGRKIFGAVVPYNRFWRTGANNATVIKLNNPVYFNGKKLDKGRYSIFTIPSTQEWTLIFNSQADIWGTDYNPEFDVFRVPMKTQTIAAPVEKMTIDISPDKNGGILSVEWEKTRATARFTSGN